MAIPGRWKVQRAATSGLKEVIKNAEFIVNFSSRVAKLDLRLDPSRSRERLTDASNSDFEREYEAVRQIFEQINREFKSVVDAQPTASSWREIDELLRVPMIPSTVRKRLVETAVIRSLEHGLIPRPRALRSADAKAELKPADTKADVKPADTKAEVKPTDAAPEVEPREPTGEPADQAPGLVAFTDSDDGPEPEVTADPAFWAQADGMALLEWSLLAMANVEGMLPAEPMTRQGNGSLDQLREAITSASQIDGTSDPARAYEYHRNRVSAQLRFIRSALVASCTKRGDALDELREPWDENHRNRVALERALISLPLPLVQEVVTSVRNPRLAKLSADLAAFQLQALLLRHARRLLQDLDTNRAGIFLKMADVIGTATSQHLKVRQNLGKMQAARIKISGAKVVVGGNVYENKMEVLIEPDRTVPKGRAVLSFAPYAKKDLSILLDDARAKDADVTLGAVVPVDPDGPPAKVGFVVQRGNEGDDRDRVVDHRDRVEKDLAPFLFYRGHTFQTSEPIKVVLEPLKDIIYVTLRPDRQSILNGARDQFRLHPGEGYIHYNEDLKYEIGLTNVTNTNQDVFLETKLEQDPESEQYAPVKLKGKETKLGVIKDLVRGVDLKELGQKALRSREVGLGRPRHLEITVWDSPARGRRLTTRRVRFTHLDVGAYAAMGQVYFDSGTQRVILTVRHLGTDPGKGYIEDVIASIDRVSQPATTQGDSLGPPTKISKNDFYVFWFGVDPKTPKVTWSVSVGKKSNAFAGTLAISAGGDEKEKEKNAEPPKE